MRLNLSTLKEESRMFCGSMAKAVFQRVQENARDETMKKLIENKLRTAFPGLFKFVFYSMM